MLLQFTDQKFKNNHEATIGIEFGSQIMSIRDKIIKLQIWDSVCIIKRLKLYRLDKKIIDQLQDHITESMFEFFWF